MEVIPLPPVTATDVLLTVTPLPAPTFNVLVDVKSPPPVKPVPGDISTAL